MAKCLNCEKEYVAKRETSKFCSDSCRVRHHQKNGKKDKIATQNEMRLILSKMNNAITELQSKVETANLGQKTAYEPMFQQPVRVQSKSFAQYEQEKLACETPEQWAELSKQIQNDTLLPTKHRNYLLNKR